MKRAYRILIVGIASVVLFFVGAILLTEESVNIATYTREFEKNLASVFFAQSVTKSDLLNKYRKGEKIKILIVPGHEPDSGGAMFRTLKEREMALDLGENLARLFASNPRYDVTMSRDRRGWNPVLQAYFTEQWDSINAFAEAKKVEMNRLASTGPVQIVTDGVPHAAAKSDVATRLYGINKWANENEIDITIHIHFNDYPRKNMAKPGEYVGFTMYIPEIQYSNAVATEAVAQSVFRRLAETLKVSTYPKESAGIVGDQELIAIGSRNTADGVSMLIEYGYVYEEQFKDPAVRKTLLNAMALQTFRGIQDFFLVK